MDTERNRVLLTCQQVTLNIEEFDAIGHEIVSPALHIQLQMRTHVTHSLPCSPSPGARAAFAQRELYTDQLKLGAKSAIFHVIK